jgi:hypothetical protein
MCNDKMKRQQQCNDRAATVTTTNNNNDSEIDCQLAFFAWLVDYLMENFMQCALTFHDLPTGISNGV